MSTDTTTTGPGVREVATARLRPGIASACVVAMGVWDARTQGRGVEIAVGLTFDDHEVERHVYDFLPGWDRSADYGGWNVEDVLVQKTMAYAEAWAVETWPAAPWVEV